MLDIKSDIKSLISSIYECQKKIMFYRRMIREQEFDTNREGISKILDEIELLESKIKDLKNELKAKYNK